MSVGATDGSPCLRHQPDEQAPARPVGLGLQLAVLNIAGVVLIPLVERTAADISAAYLRWAVLA